MGAASLIRGRVPLLWTLLGGPLLGAVIFCAGDRWVGWDSHLWSAIYVAAFLVPFVTTVVVARLALLRLRVAFGLAVVATVFAYLYVVGWFMLTFDGFGDELG